MSEKITWKNGSTYERDAFLRKTFKAGNVLYPSTSVDAALKLIPPDWELELTKFPGFPADPWEAIVSVPTKDTTYRAFGKSAAEVICRALLTAKGYTVE